MSSSSTTSNTSTSGRPGAPTAARTSGAQRPGAPSRAPGVAPGGPQRPAQRPGVAKAGGETARPQSASAPSAERAAAPEPVEDGAPRQVRLTVAHINAWTVLRLSFLLSVAVGVVLVVVVALMWGVLDGIGVFTSANNVIRDVVGSESSFNLDQYVGLSRVLSLTVLVAVVDVVLLTVLATLTAVLYNICGALVGGVRLTLTDD